MIYHTSRILGAIEIGTAQVSLLIASVSSQKSLSIIGYTQVPSKGVCKGEVVDLKACSECVAQALEKAQQKANARPEELLLSLSGCHLEGMTNQATVQVSAHNKEVRKSDLERVFRETQRRQLPSGKVYLHHLKNRFWVDQSIAQSPLGMTGEELSAQCWSMFANASQLGDTLRLLNNLGLRVEQVMAASLASGFVLTTQRDRQLGALIIDLGAGTSDAILFHEGAVHRSCVIPVGAQHLISDLTIGLQVSEEEARHLLSACIDLSASDAQSSGVISLEKRTIPIQAVRQIVRLRLEELFKFIEEDMAVALELKALGAGVILTGGLSQLKGLVPFLSHLWSVSVRLGKAPNWVKPPLNHPSFTTSLGLMHAYLFHPDTFGATAKESGFFGRIAHYFKPLKPDF